MGKLIILGSGAAPGVPALANGWGNCDPNNPKNVRRRSGAYVEIKGVKFLIDTSPDLHQQLIDHSIRSLDAVLYTHSHADHLHGIDDLRDINRITLQPLNVYANQNTVEVIRKSFAYLVAEADHPNNPTYKPSLIVHQVKEGNSFEIKGVKITPLALGGHAVPSTGYMFNDGELVYIADCKEILPESLALIKQTPQIMVMPLTTPQTLAFHMGLETVLGYVQQINPRLAVLNHMAVECDYDEINRLTPGNVVPAYDNMELAFEERVS